MKMKYTCDEHSETSKICGCGLVPGQLQMRNGLLCAVDAGGHLYLRAPRRSDVQLAQRVVATMANAESDTARHLVADLKGVGPK